MDQDEQKLKHRCRYCRKSFSSGRSLGGHMRCHVSSMSSAAAAADIEEMHEPSRGYGLRENPKKTWRLSDSAAMSAGFDEKRYCCRECGKEFQSWKALFGHMKSHSNKSAEPWSDDDHGGAHIAVRTVPMRKRRSRRAGSASSSASAEVSYSKQQEDVAIALIMLSRDLGYWTNGFPDSSDKNSVVFEGCRDFDEENSDDDSIKKKRIGSVGIIDSKLNKYGFDADTSDSKLGRSKFECTTCNKCFHSYQALGGHRASHKRMRGFFDPNGLETEDALINKDQHQCLICSKMFGSGQALGGHKRTHLVMATPIVAIRQHNSNIDDDVLIDLNLPAAAMDEDSSKESVSAAAAVGAADYRSWWAGSSALQRETLAGMFTN